MNTRRAIFLVAAIGLVAIFQGCGESRKRNVSDPARINERTAVSTADNKSPADRQTGGAKIKVVNPECNFGVVGPGKKVKCEFNFTNVGTEELVIDRILSTCQCSVPELKKKNYAPGESGVIEVTYLSSTHAAPVEKYLHILSNDKSNPRYELTLKGRVELQVVADPNELELFLNRPNGGLGPITIKSRDGKAFSIKSFSASQNIISAQFDPSASKPMYTITPTVDVQRLKSDLRGSIQIAVTHPETSQISLSYTALPMYVLTPPRLTVQDAEPGKPMERELWLKNNYDDKVEIESASSMNGHMSLIKQDHQGNSVKLTVRITPPPQTGSSQRYLSDRLTIRMKDGEEISATCSGWYKLNVLR